MADFYAVYPSPAGATSGTVTSVGLAAPALFTVSGSPVTTSGTLTLSYSGTALPIANGGTGVTSLGDLTEATSSVLTISGGTGSVIHNASIQVKQSNTTTSGYLSSTDWNTFNNKQGSGSYITALTGDVTASGPGSAVATLAATTNGTLTSLTALTTASNLVTVGTIGTGTWAATTIAVNHGGTGQVTAAAAFNALSPITTTGDMIYSPAGATSQRLAIGSTGNVLTVVGGVPTWTPPATSGTVTSVGLSVPATSIFGVSGSPVTSSGTLGLTTTGTSGGIPYFSSTSQIGTSALLTASQLVLGGGAGAAPSTLGAGSQFQVLVMGASNPGYGQVNLAQSAAITGTLPVGNGGTGVVSSTGSGANVLGTSPTITTPVIVGVNGSGAAAAGDVGEVISSGLARGSGVTLMSGSAVNITSIALTAGDWEISALWGIQVSAGVTTGIDCNISTTTGATAPTSAIGLPSATGQLRLFLQMPAGTDGTQPGFSYQLLTSSSTTLFLVALSTFTGTAVGYGTIQARRMR